MNLADGQGFELFWYTRVESARKVIMHEMGIKMRLRGVDAPIVHRVAPTPARSTPLAPHPPLGLAHEAGGQLVHVHPISKALGVGADLGRPVGGRISRANMAREDTHTRTHAHTHTHTHTRTR